MKVLNLKMGLVLASLVFAFPSAFAGSNAKTVSDGLKCEKMIDKSGVCLMTERAAYEVLWAKDSPYKVEEIGAKVSGGKFKRTLEPVGERFCVATLPSLRSCEKVRKEFIAVSRTGGTSGVAANPSSYNGQPNQVKSATGAAESSNANKDSGSSAQSAQ